MRILVADDDRDIAEMLSHYLRGEGHEVITVTAGGLAVMHFYNSFHPDVVLMDVMMPKFNGITISHAILSKNPQAKLILMSGKLNADHPFVASAGARHFFAKPLHLNELKAALERLAAPVEVTQEAVLTA